MTNNFLVKRTDPEFTEQTETINREAGSLAIKVAKLQKENHYLRRSNRVRPHLKLVLRAQAAANLLAIWHCAGYMTGRNSAFVAGMSHDTFYAGRALCVLANVHNGHGWTTANPGLIEQKLSEAFDYAKRNPEALIANIPASKQPKGFGG